MISDKYWRPITSRPFSVPEYMRPQPFLDLVHRWLLVADVEPGNDDFRVPTTPNAVSATEPTGPTWNS
jgi:hypothetical protein